MELQSWGFEEVYMGVAGELRGVFVSWRHTRTRWGR